MNLECFISCLFQVVSNRLWAHTKQKKGHCVRTRSSQRFSLYNIERENPFEGRLLVCKVAKKVRFHFQVSGSCGKDFFKVL